MVFCAVNANVFARGSQTSALIANAMLVLSRSQLQNERGVHQLVQQKRPILEGQAISVDTTPSPPSANHLPG
jgi:Tfp pilus assembly protein PilW